MPSKARIALDKNLKDVEALLKLHEEKSGCSPGRRYGLEVLNKSAIVLITSYWEAYCEDIAEEGLECIVTLPLERLHPIPSKDIAEEGLECIVTHAKTSDALPKEIKKIIAKELKEDRNELAIWEISDDKWRVVLRGHLNALKEARNRKLNTPKYKNIDDLFESAIGLSDVSSKWVWAKKLTAEKARKKLDKFVGLRGKIAHRGKAETSVTKAQVIDYLEFVKQAAAKTGGAVNIHVHSITEKKLF